MQVAVSFLKSKFSLHDTIINIDNTDVDYIHVDIMDGKLVSNCTNNLDEIINELVNVNKQLDVHLMVKNPLEFIKKFENMNVYNITIHLNIEENVLELINYIHNKNIKAGIAINPDESVYDAVEYLKMIDYLLIMGVNPGRGGQSLIMDTVDKVLEFKKYAKKNKYNYIVAFDGGVNGETYKFLKDVDLIISGSYVCTSDDYQNNINILRGII